MRTCTAIAMALALALAMILVQQARGAHAELSGLASCSYMREMSLLFRILSTALSACGVLASISLWARKRSQLPISPNGHVKIPSVASADLSNTA